MTTENQSNNLEGKIAEDQTPEISVDNNGKIVDANPTALKMLEYDNARELNWCLKEPGKRAIDRVLVMLKSFNIESPTIEYLRIKTHDKKWLLLYDLGTRIEKESGLSVISFKHAKKEDLKNQLLTLRADICFRAPKYLDNKTDEEGGDSKSKGGLQYILKYCTGNLEPTATSSKSDNVDDAAKLDYKAGTPLRLNHRVEINMKYVEQIGDNQLDFITQFLTDANLILSNPSPEVYKKLMDRGLYSMLFLSKM